EVRPDLVVTANFDLEAYGGLNQADHRVAGLAPGGGPRDAANPWGPRELRAEHGLVPWDARAPLIAGQPEPTHATLLTAGRPQAAVDSLRAHEAYLRHIGDHPDPAVFIPEILEEGGAAAGSQYAVTFRVHDL